MNFYKNMLRVRKEYKELFIHGSFEALDWENENVFCFMKKARGRKALVVLNFTGAVHGIPKVEAEIQGLKLLAGNVDGSEGLQLQPWEGRVYVS